ncbi:MAG: STAS/SEC14 domain-containing protein [Chitinophagaceae bacterium]|nr:STAS/SEC14 domain-containing protein [Chitinophagaceae bacterium]
MIEQLKDTPTTIAAFRASGEVTREDFETVVIPVVNQVVEKTGRLDYLMVIDTPLKNFTIGAWWEDVLMGLKKITKWHRAAIVTDSNAINKFTDIFSVLVPGEFRGFKYKELDDAVRWVAS